MKYDIFICVYQADQVIGGEIQESVTKLQIGECLSQVWKSMPQATAINVSILL